MATWRVTVKCLEMEKAEEFKMKFYKLLYEERGPTLVFEVPTEDKTEPILAEAEKDGYKAEKTEHDDPLEDAAPVDFW
jgi:hypothetical protein